MIKVTPGCEENGADRTLLSRATAKRILLSASAENAIAELRLAGSGTDLLVAFSLLVLVSSTVVIESGH